MDKKVIEMIKNDINSIRRISKVDYAVFPIINYLRNQSNIEVFKCYFDEDYADFVKYAIAYDNKNKQYGFVTFDKDFKMRRFNLARAYGRFIYSDLKNPDKNINGKYFYTVNSSDVTEIEIEFANSLLMPAEFILRDYEYYCEFEKDNTLEKMSDKYLLPENIILERINELTGKTLKGVKVKLKES